MKAMDGAEKRWRVEINRNDAWQISAALRRQISDCKHPSCPACRKLTLLLERLRG